MQQFYLESQGNVLSLFSLLLVNCMVGKTELSLIGSGTSPPTHVKGTKNYCLLQLLSYPWLVPSAVYSEGFSSWVS